MESFLLFSFLALALFFLSKPIIKSVVFPRWAKRDYKTAWGIVFFDRNVWLKFVIIKIGQSILVVFLLFFLLIKFSIKTAAGIVLPKKLNPIK